MTSGRHARRRCRTRRGAANFTAQSAGQLDHVVGAPDDRRAFVSPTRPGLVKVRAIPLVGARRIVLVGVALPRLLELFDAADVISEGREVIGAGGRPVYYGSTSFVLALADAEPELLAALAGDVHLRALALRRAREEAAARASGAVGTVRAELSMRSGRGALEIVVDLEVAVGRAARAQR